jgi:protein-S-isoprenylcysteine O-methyltransferase Ste14
MQDRPRERIRQWAWPRANFISVFAWIVSLALVPAAMLWTWSAKWQALVMLSVGILTGALGGWIVHRRRPYP